MAMNLELDINYDDTDYDNTYWYYDDVKEKWIYEECSTNASSVSSKQKKLTLKKKQQKEVRAKQAIQDKLDIARSTKLNLKFGESFSRNKLELVHKEQQIITDMVKKKHNKLNIPEVRTIDVRRM